MRGFDDVVAMAAGRRGGMVALEEELATTRSLSVAAIAATPDDRILSAMTRRVFQAGFSWKVIDAKWDGFEAAFDSFDPSRCAFMSETQFDALLKDTRIISQWCEDPVGDCERAVHRGSGQRAWQRGAVFR